MSHVKQVVAYIRAHGPLMKLEIAERFGWSNTKTQETLAEARGAGLVARIGKNDRGRFIFGAVQTRDWPNKGAANGGGKYERVGTAARLRPSMDRRAMVGRVEIVAPAETATAGQ